MRRREFLSHFGTAFAGWPLAASAQQMAKTWRIGILTLLESENNTSMKWMLARLHELGYEEGRNLAVYYRAAAGQPEQLPHLAAELVALRPDVVVTGVGTLAAKAAKAATSSVPIVFTTVGDPVGAGLVESLGRRAGNVTGLSEQSSDLGGKRLQLLQEATGGKADYAVLMNPATPFSGLALKVIEEAAQVRHVRIRVLEARRPDEVVSAIGDIRSDAVAGVVVLSDPLIRSMHRQIVEQALKKKLPTVFQYRDYVEAGGLMSYGPDRRQFYVRTAEYVDKILKGAKPGDLPVEQPTKFEFVINARTARALGLDMPTALLVAADEVID
jgi:putative tryptophan/tyrosine transport system substrate-binding protein